MGESCNRDAVSVASSSSCDISGTLQLSMSYESHEISTSDDTPAEYTRMVADEELVVQ